MRVLREVKNPYIEANKRRNLSIFAILVAFSISLFVLGVWLTWWLLLIGWAPLALSTAFLRRYHIWNAGVRGEKVVSRALQRLDDSYYLLNGIVLPGGRGDIDHIILGPKGVFVIEAKNYSGTIVCKGDEWYRRRRGAKKTMPMDSISAQVKRNASDLSYFVQRTARLNLPVSPVCVFVNPSVQLELTNPTVPTLRLHELTRFIQNAQPLVSLSEHDLQKLGQSILKASAK